MAALPGGNLIDFAFIYIAALPLTVSAKAARPWRLAAMFLWFPWWLFLTAPVWIPLELVGFLIFMWEEA